MVAYFVNDAIYKVIGLNILNKLSLSAAKAARSPKRKGRADQKHGPPPAGEGAARSREGEPAEGVRAGEGDLCSAETREPSKGGGAEFTVKDRF